MAFAFIPITLSLALLVWWRSVVLFKRTVEGVPTSKVKGVSWAERGQGRGQIGPSLGNLSYGNAERMVQMEHFRGMAKNRNLQGQGWEQEDPHEKRLANG